MVDAGRHLYRLVVQLAYRECLMRFQHSSLPYDMFFVHILQLTQILPSSNSPQKSLAPIRKSRIAGCKPSIDRRVLLHVTQVQFDVPIDFEISRFDG